MWDQLKELSVGNLGGEELDSVLAHIEGCPSCSEDLDVLASLATFAAERGEDLFAEEERVKSEWETDSVIREFLRKLKSLFAPFPLPVRVLVPVATAVILLFAYNTLTHRSDVYRSFVDLTPAPYYQVSLRGDVGETETLFRSAMEYYLDGDYANASSALGSLIENVGHDETIIFYYGISSLLSGDVAEAVQQLKKTADSENVGLRQKSIYYLAQAHLLEGDREAAEVSLQSLAGEESEYGKKADEQLRTIVGVEER
jgi:hypothetical protein